VNIFVLFSLVIQPYFHLHQLVDPMSEVIVHVDNFAMVENIHLVDHYIFHDHDHDHPYVLEVDNDEMVVMVNVDVFDDMVMVLDDFYH
jgi:hypothetical protein